MATLPKEPFRLAPPPRPVVIKLPLPGISEDWLAVCLGLLVFVLSLGLVFGADLLGWVVTTSVWTDPAKALAPASRLYAHLPPWGSLIGTYVSLLVVLLAGAKALRVNLARFAAGFTAVFVLSYACWFVGNWAHLAATPDKRQALLSTSPQLPAQ